MPRLNLDPDVKTQLDTWVNEPGGLRDDLLNTEFINRLSNLTNRVDLGGQSLLEDTQAQVDCFTFMILNDGLIINRNQIFESWRRMIRGILDSYTRTEGGTVSYGVNYPASRPLTTLETKISEALTGILNL